MSISVSFFFFFNDTATTEIYTLSLHDALPISCRARARGLRRRAPSLRRTRCSRRSGGTRADRQAPGPARSAGGGRAPRSEEHTSELQSLAYLVCRLLLEKKKKFDCCVMESMIG